MAAEAAVQERMKSNLRTFIQMVLNQAKQSTKGYALNVEGNILSLETILTQDIRGMSDLVTDHLDRRRRDVSNMGEGLSLQLATDRN